MSAIIITDQDRALAAEYGQPAEVAAKMRMAMEARSVVDESDVTRWTKCSDCGHRASVSITLADPLNSAGAWVCDECGSEWVDEFRFTKAERARFAAIENGSE